MKIAMTGSTGFIGTSLKRILKQHGHQVVSLRRQDLDRGIDHLVEIMTGTDAVINLAGAPINRRWTPSYPEFTLTIWSTFTCMLQAALPALNAAPQAAVVLFSTVAVSTGMPMHASVASAKGAVEGLTRSLAAELAPKIRVNAIAPSLTETPLAARLLRTERQRTAAVDRHPLERVGQPADIAAAARFLLSDDASWITGQVLAVDGGIGAVRRFS